MTQGILDLGAPDALYYEHDPPPGGAHTFVFVNALTSSTALWQAEIGPSLRAHGYGTLAYDFRGQARSTFSLDTVLDQTLIVNDLKHLLDVLAPHRPILVGLSIGGLFAAWAHLDGAAARGLVLINTLRSPGARLEWINAAMARAAGLGGTRLVMDMYMPLLVSAERAADVRGDFLTDAPYEPLPPSHGHAQLFAHAGSADWDLPYERIGIPTIVMTGLQDRVFYDAADVAALTARLPNAHTVEMADAGHLIPVERPAAVIRALAEFAERL
jgi:pimeloyl-ACP methyl ester carboxylesterase